MMAGFALGFRMEVLQNVLARKDEPMKMPRDVYVYRVLYDRKKQENITTCILETWRREFLKKHGENAEQEELYLALFQTLEFYTPFLKHPCYVSEKECRLVLDGVSIDEDEINYLPRRGYFKPFIDLSIDNRNQQFPLHTVVVGPATNPSRCERSLRMFLNNHLPERTDIQICRSALPYLGRT